MINNKQQTIIETIKEVFEGENMQSEYSVLSWYLFQKHKLSI